MERIKITGVMCTNCVQHVNEALADLPGICGLDVQLTNQVAVVSYDDEKISSEQISECIIAEGYGVEKIK